MKEESLGKLGFSYEVVFSLLKCNIFYMNFFFVIVIVTSVRKYP